jgi:hypothetical protein
MALRGESSFHSVQCPLTMLYAVYALYRNSQKIACVLITSFIVEHAMITAFSVTAYPYTEYDNLCISTQVSPTVVGIGCV